MRGAKHHGSDTLRLALKLTRLIADFPGIIYLLGYDRAQVEKLLGEHGREYLEKFVQVSFEVPRAEQGDIKQYLFKRIGQVLDRLPRDADERPPQLDVYVMGRYWSNGLCRMLSTLREVNLLVNSIDVTLRPIVHEVCIEDAVALESIRLRRPSVVDVIKVNARMLLGYSLKRKIGNEWDAEYREWYAANFQEGHDVDGLDGVLFTMFPVVGLAVNPSMHGGGALRVVSPTRGPLDNGDTCRLRSICDPKFFDRYFRKKLVAGDVSERELDVLRKSLGDIDGLRQSWSLLLELVDRTDFDPMAIAKEQRLNIAQVIAEQCQGKFSHAFLVNQVLGDDVTIDEIDALVKQMGVVGAVYWAHMRRVGLRRADDPVLTRLLNLSLGSPNFWNLEGIAILLSDHCVRSFWSPDDDHEWVRYCRGWEKLSGSEFFKLVQKIMTRSDIASLFFEIIPRDIVLDKLRNITPAEEPDIGKLIEFVTATEQAG